MAPTHRRGPMSQRAFFPSLERVRREIYQKGLAPECDPQRALGLSHPRTGFTLPAPVESAKNSWEAGGEPGLHPGKEWPLRQGAARRPEIWDVQSPCNWRRYGRPSRE